MKLFTSFRYVRQHLRPLAIAALRDTLSWSLLGITVIGSLIAFLPKEEGEWLQTVVQFCCVSHWWILVLIAILVIMLAVAINWPRTIAVYKDKSTDIHVIIECCDLLQQQGVKVIHAVDTFDTELGRIISPQSLHGAFLRLCNERQVPLDEKLDTYLQDYTAVKEDNDLPGRKLQYPLGTVCPIDIEEERFCCVAFTHLRPNGTIEITKEEYIQCLKQMWRNLAEPRIRGEEVNVAVMGNRFVDLPAEFSTEQKIDLMIQTFFAVAREKACCRVLRICVHPDNAPDIDFEKYPVIIEHLAKRPVI